MQLHDVPTDEDGAPVTQGEGADEVAGQGLANMTDLLSMESPESAAELQAGLEQIRGYITSFESPAAMFAALGWDEGEFEDESDATSPSEPPAPARNRAERGPRKR
jgi:hypothetical protein